MLTKKINIIIIVTISLCLVALSHRSYAVEKVEIITCECPPLSYELNGRAEGPSVDIVKHIQKRINTNENIRVYPWARGYKIVQEQPNVVLFSTTRTKQRENMFKWVGPIVEKRFSFHARKGSTIKINNLKDAKKYLIGVVHDSNNEQFLIYNGFKKLSLVTVENQNLLKLQKNRIDLWYTDTAQSSALMAKYSLEGMAEEIYVVQKSRSYYAFNLKTPDSIVKKWQNALNHLRKTGTVLNILKKYKLESMYAD
ncbi:ABC transporter substrate-binding protein [Desulfococcaceae bacterium HSG9]|nr:ABC transporter substrate-binding protein [Desulfococcaceae bacterium HSG9]